MVESSPGVPLLIGILADVSGSMRASIGSSGTSAINRLEAFSAALENLVKQAAGSVHKLSGGPMSTTVRFFIYGFGFGNALSLMLGRGGPGVRDLFSIHGNGERTVDAIDLANNWEWHLANVRSMAIDMFGSTPMKAAFEMAKRRLAAEHSKDPAASLLFVLSDGEPTDGSRNDILSIADEIRRSGTIIVSCFVTDTDVTEPKHLYGRYQNNWIDAAKLMFDCASKLQPQSTFYKQLQEFGWQLDPEAKLFCQVNQSEMLSQFLGIVLSPLREGVEGKDDNADISPAIESTHSPSIPRIASSLPSRKVSKITKIRLLFLHGLGGRAELTWGRLPEFLMADQEIKRRFSVGFYSFPTSLFRLPFSTRAPKIQELTAGLRTQIEHDEFERVDLVCHSLGGLGKR